MFSCFGTQELKVDKHRDPFLTQEKHKDLCDTSNLPCYGGQESSVQLPRGDSFSPQPEGLESSAPPPRNNNLRANFLSGTSEDMVVIDSLRRTVENQSMGAMKKLNKDSSSKDFTEIPKLEPTNLTMFKHSPRDMMLYRPVDNWDVTLHLHEPGTPSTVLLPKDSKISENSKESRTWPDGSTYTGQWGENGAEGFGTLRHADGDTYKGSFCDGLAHGHGKLQEFRGGIGLPAVTYHGQWHFDIKSGQGAEEWRDGARFEGEYVDGLKHGFGIFLWPNGSSYQGQFCDDVPSGEGRYSAVDGRWYSGSWEKGKMHGKGHFVFPGEGQYLGQFHEGHRHGEGVFVWRDGRKYTGEWHEDSQHGKGVLTSVDGTEPPHIGIWHHGKNTSPSPPHGKWTS